MSQPATDDLRIRTIDPLATPAEVMDECPATPAALATVGHARAALHRILAGPPRNLALLTLPLLILVIGIFLSFSRGAWGVLVASFALLTAALYLQSNSGRFRLKLTVMAIVAVAIVGFSVIAILWPAWIGWPFGVLTAWFAFNLGIRSWRVRKRHRRALREAGDD